MCTYYRSTHCTNIHCTYKHYKARRCTSSLHKHKLQKHALHKHILQKHKLQVHALKSYTWQNQAHNAQARVAEVQDIGMQMGECLQSQTEEVPLPLSTSEMQLRQCPCVWVVVGTDDCEGEAAEAWHRAGEARTKTLMLRMEGTKCWAGQRHNKTEMEDWCRIAVLHLAPSSSTTA